MTETIDGIIDETVVDMMEQSVKTGAQITTGGTVANIFTITGGPILVTAFVGEVTTAISDNASTLTLTMDPTAGADTGMNVALDLADFAINTWISIDGTIGNAAVEHIPGTTLPLGIGMDIPLVLPPGTVDMVMSNNNTTTGAITWYMRYKPLSSGITVVGKA